MVIFAIPSLTLGLLTVFSFLTLDVVTFCHQIRHLKNHRPIIRLLSLAPTAFSFSCEWLWVLIMVQLGVIHRMMIVGIILRDRLKLGAIIGVDMWTLMRIGSWYRIPRMNIIKSHIPLLLIRMRNSSIHGFNWKLWIELAAGCWALRAAHHLCILVHYHLMPWSVPRHSWRLHSSNPMSPLHHLIKNFLLGWIGICLILFTDRRASVPGVVPDTKKISSCIIPTIWLRLILITISRGHTTAVFRIWVHLSHLTDIQTWWLRRLPGNRMVLKCMLPNMITSLPFLRLISSIVI